MSRDNILSGQKQGNPLCDSTVYPPAIRLGACEGAVGSTGAATRRWSVHTV